MQKELSLEKLADLDDGRVLIAWEHALNRVMLDCEDRPGAGVRKVTLELTLTPVCDDNGYMVTVEGKFVVKDTIPPRKTVPYDLVMRKSSTGGRCLMFNDMSDDNALQRTLDEGDGFDE